MRFLGFPRALRQLLRAVAVFAVLAGGSAQAALVEYEVEFSATTGNDGTGHFFWDDATQTMTAFTWSFADGEGGFLDSALAKTIYSPGSARSVGALLYYLFTDPVTYWLSTNGLLSSSSGYFTTSFFGSWGSVFGDFPADMFSIEYHNGDAAVTYGMYDLSPSRVLQSGGTITASAVPEPGALWLVAAAVLMLVLYPGRSAGTQGERGLAG